MAENKQYITQTQDHGTVKISEDVVAAIVINSLSDIEGFAGLSAKPGADIAEIIGKKNWGKGVKVSIAEDNSISVVCNVLSVYGYCIVEVAKAVQRAATAALENTTGCKVTSVNVNICGIVRK